MERICLLRYTRADMHVKRTQRDRHEKPYGRQERLPPQQAGTKRYPQRRRADIGRFFDGFTLVEPGLVTPDEWRPDLDNPLPSQGADDSDEGPVIQPLLPRLPAHGSGVAWHFCGIGVKD